MQKWALADRTKWLEKEIDIKGAPALLKNAVNVD